MRSQELFERYLAAITLDEDSEGTLETLLVDFAQPIVHRVVKSRLGSLYTPADAAELSSEAMVELLSRLRAVRRDAPGAGTLPFDSLAAGVAANTVHRFFARRFPERNRLRKRLRYVIETGARFRLWLTAGGATVCGLAAARDDDRTADTADVGRCVEQIRTRPLPAHPLSTLVYEILRVLGRPIDLSRLTGIAADLTGLREPSFLAPAADFDDARDILLDPAPSAALRAELRERLEHLWRDVLLLSARHRTALLLSARASTGAALWLVADLGIASFREVAAALEVTVEDLAEIWNRLPLDDREIAARLGIERQQAINLRSTARERLQRRADRVQYRAKPIKGESGS